jgi:hypothetical protein
MGKTVLIAGIKIALVLLSIGMLPKATLWLQKKAYTSLRTGLVSMHSVNSSLVREKRPNSK